MALRTRVLGTAGLGGDPQPPDLDMSHSLPLPRRPLLAVGVFVGPASVWVPLLGHSPWGSGSRGDEAFGERRQHREH